MIKGPTRVHPSERRNPGSVGPGEQAQGNREKVGNQVHIGRIGKIMLEENRSDKLSTQLLEALQEEIASMFKSDMPGKSIKFNWTTGVIRHLEL